MTDAEVTHTSSPNKLPINEHILLSKIDNEIYIATEEGVYYLNQTTDEIVEAKDFSGIIGKSWGYLVAQEKQKKIWAGSEVRESMVIIIRQFVYKIIFKVLCAE